MYLTRIAEEPPGEDEGVVHAETTTVVLRTAAASAVQLRSESAIDRFGRTRWELSHGFVGEPGDEAMRHSRWAMEPAAWIHRPCEAWVGTGAADDPAAGYGRTQTFYDELEGDGNVCEIGARGLATSSRVRLFSRDLGGALLTSGDWLEQGATAYNDQGLVTESWVGVSSAGAAAGEALQHSARTYDAQYGAAVISESIQANRPGEAAYSLSTSATWDTNLGALTSLTDFNGQMAHVVYDRLGRMVATYRPLCGEPSVVHEYNLDPSGAFHHVHTRVNEVCDDVTATPTPSDDPLSQLLGATGLQEAGSGDHLL